LKIFSKFSTIQSSPNKSLLVSNKSAVDYFKLLNVEYNPSSPKIAINASLLSVPASTAALYSY